MANLLGQFGELELSLIEVENLSVLRITVCYVPFTEGKLLNQVVAFLLNTENFCLSFAIPKIQARACGAKHQQEPPTNCSWGPEWERRNMPKLRLGLLLFRILTVLVFKSARFQFVDTNVRCIACRNQLILVEQD